MHFYSQYGKAMMTTTVFLLLQFCSDMIWQVSLLETTVFCDVNRLSQLLKKRKTASSWFGLLSYFTQRSATLLDPSLTCYYTASRLIPSMWLESPLGINCIASPIEITLQDPPNKEQGCVFPREYLLSGLLFSFWDDLLTCLMWVSIDTGKESWQAIRIHDLIIDPIQILGSINVDLLLSLSCFKQAVYIALQQICILGGGAIWQISITGWHPPGLLLVKETILWSFSTIKTLATF